MHDYFNSIRTTFIFALLLVTRSLLPDAALAQWYIGGGLLYGRAPGLQANTYFVIGDKNRLRLGADASFNLFESETIMVNVNGADIEESVKFDLFATDVNGHYMLVATHKLNLYALTGLNLTFKKYDESAVPSRKDFEIGLNLGGGLEYGVPLGRIYGELKYVVGYSQLVGGVGIRLPLLGRRN